MGKLFKLKEWLTLAEAAKHLTTVCEEEVSEADILRLGLEGRLQLSVHFLNRTYGRPGRIVPVAQAQYREVPTLDGTGTLRLYNGPVLMTAGVESHVIEPEGEVGTLLGTYDLPMIGSERITVDNMFRRLGGLPEGEYAFSIDGAFVRGRDGIVIQLLQDPDDYSDKHDRSVRIKKLTEQMARRKADTSEAQDLPELHSQDSKKYVEEEKPLPVVKRYHPISLPEDCILVVRTEALRELEQQLSDAPAPLEKPLGSNERYTYLVTVAALCNRLSIDCKGRGAAVQIAAITEEFGVPVSDDTLREMLRKLPDALASRTK